MRSTDADTLTKRTQNLGQVFVRVENIFAEGPYFHGQALSNVDIAWLPLLHRAAIIQKYTQYDFLQNFPKVQSWQSALLATGLAEKSVAADFDAEFSGFYLSNETYLGQGVNCSKTADEVCGTSSCCG